MPFFPHFVFAICSNLKMNPLKCDVNVLSLVLRKKFQMPLFHKKTAYLTTQTRIDKL